MFLINNTMIINSVRTNCQHYQDTDKAQAELKVKITTELKVNITKKQSHCKLS